MGRAFENLEKVCLCCGRERRIVNSHFKLCQECNSARLRENKPDKVKSYAQIKTKPTKTLKIDHSIKIPPRHKVTDKIRLDDEFYENCFNLSDHKCEECQDQLPTTFRDDNGKVSARWRYSHIIPKSIAPQLRHNTDNINHLCLKCHSKWETGDKVNMKIFAKNLLLFPQFLQRWLSN